MSFPDNTCYYCLCSLLKTDYKWYGEKLHKTCYDELKLENTDNGIKNLLLITEENRKYNTTCNKCRKNK